MGKPGFHDIVVGAEFRCEIGENLRLSKAEFEGEEMVIIEVLRDDGSIIAYPIQTGEARRTADNMRKLAADIDRRRRRARN